MMLIDCEKSKLLIEDHGDCVKITISEEVYATWFYIDKSNSEKIIKYLKNHFE